MATPALKSGEDARIRLEHATVVLALRRLRADLARGRVLRDRQLLSVTDIDELLLTLQQTAIKAPPSVQEPAARVSQCAERSREASSPAQRSANSWNAMARVIS